MERMFSQNKKKSILALILIILLVPALLILAACNGASPPSPSLSPSLNSSNPEASKIISNTLSEVAKVQSCQLDSTLVRTYDFHSQSEQSESIDKWTSQRLL